MAGRTSEYHGKETETKTETNQNTYDCTDDLEKTVAMMKKKTGRNKFKWSEIMGEIRNARNR